jgi:hypothetical protein
LKLVSPHPDLLQGEKGLDGATAQQLRIALKLGNKKALIFKMKTWEFVLLGLFLLGLPAVTSAQFTFSTNADNTITITGYTGSESDVTIPDTINGLPVTSIGNAAFIYYYSMTNVLIADSVTNIDVGAFSECFGLTSVTIPNSVFSIGNNAFGGCRGLTNVIIGNRVADVGPFAFGECFGLVTVIIPEGVINLGEQAFDNCSSLANVILPSSLAIVGDSAFFACASLTNVIISDGTLSIGNQAFKNCSVLPDIIIPNSVTNIGDYAFDSCYDLTNVTIGTNVVSIGEYAFANSGLHSVIFPKSINSIGDHAFDYCHGLEGIFYGNAPIFLGTSAFVWSPGEPIYYLPGTMGWDNFSIYAQRPTAVWLPVMQTGDSSLGIQANQFGFNINWASGQTVVVEASTDLINWQPLQTNTLTTGTADISDSQWTNYASRFYRLLSP